METYYRIALAMVHGIGNISARKLIEHAGSAEAVFRTGRDKLLRIPGVGSVTAASLEDRSVFDRAQEELEYIRKNNISCHFIDQEGYPGLLSQCYDAPLVFYTRGKLRLEGRKVLSVVGTRRPSSYGLDICRKLVRELAGRHPGLVIVSGLAYGIDHCAHKAALDCGLDTVAVLGHGFRFMYPAIHRKMAQKIESSGTLLTDFPSREKPERNNFIKRNRIIAGISRATVVVESGERGGALITADLANSYNREVFAFPGRVGDPFAAGCNSLIKSHRAHLIEGYRDIEYQLGWEPDQSTETRQANEPGMVLCNDQQAIAEFIGSQGTTSVDMISLHTGIPVNRLSGILLELELAGVLRSLPGNCYRLPGR